MIGVGSRTGTQLTLGVKQFADLGLVLLQLIFTARGSFQIMPDVENHQQHQYGASDQQILRLPHQLRQRLSRKQSGVRQQELPANHDQRTQCTQPGVVNADWFHLLLARGGFQ